MQKAVLRSAAQYCVDYANYVVHEQQFLARDSMLSALYAIANPSVRPSVCPSVRHTGGSVENG